jgi:hypothetical protein
MAWIESHTNLDRHSKLIRFQTAMRWSRNEAVGFLHRFWWSVLEVSPSGDVTALTSPEVMSETLNMKLDVVRDAIQRLEEFGFIERNGESVYVHDWLDYAGRFLRSKFSKKRETLVSIWALHGKDYGEKDEADTQPTPKINSTDTLPTRTIPNLTIPNLTVPKEKESPLTPKNPKSIEIPEDLEGNREEIMGWIDYKREKGQGYKTKGLESLWRMLRSIHPVLRKSAIEQSMACNYAGIFPPKGGQNGNQRITGEAGYIPGKYAHLS